MKSATTPEEQKALFEQNDLSEQEALSLERKEESPLELIRGNRFNPQNFYEQFEHNSEKVLDTLLSMQSNLSPLKKGGPTIAYRCNALIIKNRNNYSIQENTLLDIIIAKMSSYPEDSYYTITVKEVMDALPYLDRGYIYKIMKNGCKSLNRKPFSFVFKLENGNEKVIEMQWNEYLIYNGKSNLELDENAYISFKPLKFFRMLTSSATIAHGAFYPISVPAQISAKVVRNMFYFLSSMKDYREYPTATPGVFQMDFSSLQDIIKYPASYKPYDIKRFILDLSKEQLSTVTGIDFTFDYELLKGDSGKTKRGYEGVRFHIKSITPSKEQKKLPSKEEEPNFESHPGNLILEGFGFSKEERKRILTSYETYHRDLAFLSEAITKVLQSDNVKSKTGLLCYYLENGITKSKPSRNSFHTSEKADYDFEELEKKLIRNQ